MNENLRHWRGLVHKAMKYLGIRYLNHSLLWVEMPLEWKETIADCAGLHIIELEVVLMSWDTQEVPEGE